MVWMALVAMMGATLATNLGLAEAIVRILLKIVRCPKCCSFWVALTVLVMIGADLITATILSLAMAYLSHWFGIALYLMNQIYDKVWKRIQRRR